MNGSDATASPSAIIATDSATGRRPAPRGQSKSAASVKDSSTIAPLPPAPGSAVAGTDTATSVAKPTGPLSHDQPAKPASRQTPWPTMTEPAQMTAAPPSTATNVISGPFPKIHKAETGPPAAWRSAHRERGIGVYSTPMTREST